MEINVFEELLKESESYFIDFKSEMYFSNSQKDKTKARAEFVKDIVSMWNTPRDRDSYIILGIRNKSGNDNELVGIDQGNIIDDADLRSKFESLVNYIPKFEFNIIDYKNLKFAIITIPIATQISIIKKEFYGNTLKKSALYYREGSKNTEALEDKEKEIYSWFRERQIITDSDLSNENLLSEMNSFDSDKYFYFLITSPLDKTSPFLEKFGLINWTFVIDFDFESQQNGLLSICRDNLEKHQSLNVIIKDNLPSIHTKYGTYWYFASGLSGNKKSLLPDKKKKTWLRLYKKDFEKQIEKISKSLGNEKPVKTLIVVENNSISSYLNTIIDSLESVFQDNLSFLMVSSEEYRPLTEIAEENEFSFLKMPLSHLCQTFDNCQKNLDFQMEGYSIPSLSGTPIPIEDKKIPWLKEEFEIVHLASGSEIPIDEINSRNYLRGHEISWENLKYNHDANRDETNKLQKLVMEALKNRKPLRINLYHIPGSGGTTIARRILWNQHGEYPCTVLLNMKSPLETMVRLDYLFSISQSSILLLIDGGLITDRQTDALYEKIVSSHLPVIMLQVIRRFNLPSISKKLRNTRTLNDQLSNNEKDYFYSLLSKEILKEDTELLKAELEGNCTPFSLGFFTFKDNYKGIDNYIKYRLENISDSHKKIIIFLSIAYYYGQKSISPQWFHKLLDISSDRYVNLKEVFNDSGITDLIIYDDVGKWRINHFIFAKKCLSYLLAPECFGNNDYDHIWKQNLSNWAKEFISFCRGNNLDISPSDESIEIIFRVFYFRDNNEVLGTEYSWFSNFIEDIDDENGKLEVFRYLTDVFHDEAQFWAHLGRFYSTIKKDPEKALESIDRALNLNEDDPLILHMKGMAIRQKIYNIISKTTVIVHMKEELYSIVDEAEKSSDCFSQCRKLNPTDEYAYISEIQMIIKVLNYAGKYHDNKPLNAITFVNSPKWLRESLENASYLLAQVRHIRQKDNVNKLEADCQSELDIMNENIEDALQKWNQLLERKELSPSDKLSVRRSIVFTRLKQANHKWDGVNNKHIKKVVELLEDNLKYGENDKDLRLWLNAIRVLPNPPSLEVIAEKVAYWKHNTSSLDAIYYLYILQVLQVLSGSLSDFGGAEANIKACHERSRYRRKNDVSFEWLSKGDSINQLVHQENLGEWDNFWSNTSALKRVKGIITSINGPAKGYIEIEETGLKAFFVPGKYFVKGSSENKNISCYLGFSYSGLRAWEVKEE